MALDAVLRGVWAWRWRISLTAMLLYVAGAALILTWPRSYQAQAVVAPAETTGIAISTLLATMPVMGGGALLDTRPSGNFAVYLDALRAPEAAAMLARDTDLLAHLTELRGAGAMGMLRRGLGLRLEADLDDARTWLERNLAATQGVATVTFTLSLSHRDRAAALDALDRLHLAAEAKVRADIADLARRRIAAVEARLATERDLYLRNVLYDLLGQQQRAALVVASEEAVAARVVSQPMVGLRPVIPNRPLLLLLLGIVAPLAVGCSAVGLVLLGFGPAGALEPALPDLPYLSQPSVPRRTAGAD
jgi:hypothetical protein